MLSLPKEFEIIGTEGYRAEENILHPFAWDELMCRRVGEGRLPVVRLWRHPNALVAGLRDRKLPQASKAMEVLRREGVSVGVRNSGGAVVPLDEGVLNLSIILPHGGIVKDFHDDFRLMVELIRESLKPWHTAAEYGEVSGAYCPGEFDVSIDGRKFCGIAQRRQTKAAVISAFIVVAGSGRERAEKAERFYRLASGGITGGYPHVTPGATGSLAELAGVPSVEAFAHSLQNVFIAAGGRLAGEEEPPLIQDEEIREMIGLLRSRYDK